MSQNTPSETTSHGPLLLVVIIFISTTTYFFGSPATYLIGPHPQTEVEERAPNPIPDSFIVTSTIGPDAPWWPIRATSPAEKVSDFSLVNSRCRVIQAEGDRRIIIAYVPPEGPPRWINSLRIDVRLDAQCNSDNDYEVLSTQIISQENKIVAQITLSCSDEIRRIAQEESLAAALPDKQGFTYQFERIGFRETVAAN